MRSKSNLMVSILLTSLMAVGCASSGKFNNSEARDVAANKAPSIKGQIEKLLNEIDADVTAANKKSGLDIVEHIAWETNIMRTKAKQISYITGIMSDKYSGLRTIHSAVRSMDGTIGSYRSSREAAEGVGTKEKWDREKRKKQQVLDFLNNGGYTGRNYTGIQRLRDSLQKIKWGSASDDRKFVFGGMARRLDSIANTNYNMHKLQGRGGLHAYRAHTRVFTHQIAGLKSFFDVNAQSCPHSDNNKDPEATEGLCKISKCVYGQISETKNELGIIKDLGEKYENMSPPKHLSHKELQPAVDIHKYNVDNKVIESAARQLRACK